MFLIAQHFQLAAQREATMWNRTMCAMQDNIAHFLNPVQFKVIRSNIFSSLFLSLMTFVPESK